MAAPPWLCFGTAVAATVTHDSLRRRVDQQFGCSRGMEGVCKGGHAHVAHVAFVLSSCCLVTAVAADGGNDGQPAYWRCLAHTVRHTFDG